MVKHKCKGVYCASVWSKIIQIISLIVAIGLSFIVCVKDNISLYHVVLPVVFFAISTLLFVLPYIANFMLLKFKIKANLWGVELEEEEKK